MTLPALRLPRVSVRRLAVFMLPALLLEIVLTVNTNSVPSQQFSELAQAFLHGHLYFLHSIGGVGQDPVAYHGHQYWDEGAFPALVLLPFVALFSAFHLFFYQEYLDWLLILGTLYLVYALARRLGYAARDSLFWAFGFVLGTAYIGISIVASAWFFAQIVTVFLLLWSLCEYFGRRRWWLIGALCACLFLTRATAATVVIFFGLELLRGGARRAGLMRFMPLVVPLAGAVVLQALYNFLRFHSPLNGGFAYQVVSQDIAEARRLGAFSPRHIPTNLYSLLFGPVSSTPATSTSYTLKFPYIRNNWNGSSLFVTSPYLFYLLGRKWSAFSRTSRNLLLAALVSCAGVLCFYGLGRNQIGYRYSLDFMPELFTVLMLVYRTEHRSLTRGMKFALLACGVFNFYLVMTALALPTH